MTESIDLPPEIEQVADLLSKQPPEVRELFRYALVLAMIDDEKARLIGTRTEAGQEYLMVRTVAGDEFETLRSRTSVEVVAKLMAQVGSIVEEDSGG